MNLRKRPLGAAAFAVLALAGCSSTAPRVDPSEPRRLVATDSNVRLDAAIRTDTLTIAQQIPIDYEITNNRRQAIAIAELIPDASYDHESRVVTIALGSEIPGQIMLPRLVTIGPGQKRAFSVNARVVIPPTARGSGPLARTPSAVQLKLSFLGDTSPFTELIGIPERVVHSRALAEELFPKWMESNETIYTNSLPMRWISRPEESDITTQPSQRGPRRP